MIHARRVKSKDTSTKEMLENTVATRKGRSGQTKAEQASASKKSNANSNANAFDAAFEKARPFSKRFKRANKNSNNNNRSKSQTTNSKFLKRLSLLAIVCVLVFGLLSMSFRTETFIVEGNAHLSTAEVQTLSKIYEGTPLLWITGRNIKDLLRNPWVDNVKINREFPNTVRIELRERTPVALLSNDSSNALFNDIVNDRVELAVQTQGIDAALIQNQAIPYSADGVVLLDAPLESFDRLARIDGWGEDQSLEGLELLNYFKRMPELSVSKINYTPEGFEISFNYGLREYSTGNTAGNTAESSTTETSFILGQLQTPSLTLLKEHWSAFVHALATGEDGEPTNMAGSPLGLSSLSGLPDGLSIVPAPQSSVGQALEALDGLDQETGRIVKRKWITVYAWGVSLSE